jgi:hypothetical protein
MITPYGRLEKVREYLQTALNHDNFGVIDHKNSGDEVICEVNIFFTDRNLYKKFTFDGEEIESVEEIELDDEETVGVTTKPVLQWQQELIAANPENDQENAIEFVQECHPDRLELDHGVHCTCCGRRENLLSNPDLPRVLCVECYTWAVIELAKPDDLKDVEQLLDDLEFQLNQDGAIAHERLDHGRERDKAEGYIEGYKNALNDLRDAVLGEAEPTDEEAYMKSFLGGNWYRVTEWRVVKPGKYIAEEKEPVGKDEVPDEVLEEYERGEQ